jgi:hypothetical protein
MKVRFLLIFLFLSAIFLVHFSFSGQAVYGDGIDYWAYLHTWYFDHDYDFNNEFRHQYQPEYNNSHSGFLTPEVQKTSTTPIGKTDNIHPAGASFFLFPFYILADLLVVILNNLGFHILRNGYSDIYQIICGLGAISYVTVSIFILRKLTGWLAAMAILFATPLLYYGSYDILNSHIISFFLSVLFWFIFLKADFKRVRWIIISGFIVGLSGLVRVQDLLLFIPLTLRLRSFKKISLSALSAILVFCPQFYIWWVLYGIPLPYTYMVGFTRQPILGSIFHPINGLIRTPILIFSLIGLPLIKNSLGYFLSFLIPVFLLVILQGGWVAPSYGARMYVSSLPVFAFFLKSWFSRLKPKIAAGMVILFSLINVFSIFSFVFLEKEVNSGAKRGLEEHTVIKLNSILHSLFK